ncbi:Alg9-like mannosyltransferase family-domain-containing protein [Dipodascopsis uninucleata]
MSTSHPVTIDDIRRMKKVDQRQKSQVFEPKDDSSQESIHCMTMLAIAVLIRTLCAIYCIIPDCDEVFNYWEPTHFITHGFGLETWEYSPKYAIRSWAYVLIHAVAVKLCQNWRIAEENLFMSLRIILGILCSLCEVILYKSIRKNISKGVAACFLFYSLTSTGMFHASVTYLPSSFSMYVSMLAMSQTLDPRSISSPHIPLFLFALSGILGWPFSVVLALPFCIEILSGMYIMVHRERIITGIFKAIVYSITALVVVIVIDSYFYGKLQIVPLNIVLYNVLNASEETGPDIFGTEPLSYYVLNLALNFNIVAILGYISVLVPVGSFITKRVSYMRMKQGRLFAAVAPLYLWSLIFFSQPHKEERFLYVIYPSICLGAALTTEGIIKVAFYISSKLFESNSFCAAVTDGTKYLLYIGTFGINISRIFALYDFYYAPITTYKQLWHVNNNYKTEEDIYSTMDRQINVCVGREWYRYTTSYFLQDNMRLKFIKSDFNGMLPAEFLEGTDIKEATSNIPSGLNNINKEEPSYYVSVSDCDFLIDSNFTASASPYTHERQYIMDTDDWSAEYCSRIIDGEHSSLLAKVLRLPDVIERMLSSHLPFHREWTSYCLLARKKNYSM